MATFTSRHDESRAVTKSVSAPKPARAKDKAGKAKAATAKAATAKSPVDALVRYHAKRDFDATTEPRGGSGPTRRALRFSVQKHDARRLHYDLRLELDGVLKSWAITRGPSLVPSQRRLAVETEDHPLDYLTWEGVIPQGQYGGGTMIVWDRGVWKPEGDPRKALEEGHLTFDLDGERLNGRWHLIRTRPRGGKVQWLLIKGKDEAARGPGDDDILEEETASVISGRTNTDMVSPTSRRRTGSPGRSGPQNSRAAPIADARRTRASLLPDFVEPCLATLSAKAPSGDPWWHELKFDGYRLQARLDGGKVRLLTRSGLDWTERFASLAQAFRKLGKRSALIDGEAVVEDERGLSSFGDLQADLKAGRGDRLVYYAFDLLHADGRDLRSLTLRARKEALVALLDDVPADGPLRLSQHLEGDGSEVVQHACRMGLEGIVSKRTDRPYRSGRGGDWLKIKCSARQELVIAGFAPSTVSRDAVGSLVFGVYETGHLRHVGRAGTGYTEREAKALFKALRPLQRRDAPFDEDLPAEARRGNVRWVEPKLVADVELRGWTADGLVRHAAFKGLREDKEAESVVRERVTSSEEPPKSPSAPATKRAAALTHPDRVLWPDRGVTKEGLADYYEAVADRILPHIVDRPLALVRCPEGVGRPCFFQKHAGAGLTDKALRRASVGDEEVLLVRDIRGLLALVQASVLEIHPWGARLTTIDKPDRLVFDLDPGEGVAWSAIVDGAKEVRDRLQATGLTAFVKTSGGKGLHVVAPLRPRADWKALRAFGADIAKAMAADTPERYVATMAKKVRTGRIFIDIHRNNRGSTAVAAYSTRARPGAAVSTPVDWDELPTLSGAAQFDTTSVVARIANMARDPWAELPTAARPLPQDPKGRGKRPRAKAQAAR